jgi:hypothetical protein
MSAVQPNWEYYVDLYNQQGRGIETVAVQHTALGASKQRYLYSLAAVGGGRPFRVHNADVQTALRGLLTRVLLRKTVANGIVQLRPMVDPPRQLVRQILIPSRNALLRHLKPVEKLTFDQFIAPFGGSKKARYVEAYESLKVEPICAKDAYLQTFVKAEKLDVSEDPDPDPRIIQPRSPRYLVALGMYMRAIEPVVFKAINKLFGRVTVMKGLNADQRGQALRAAWDEFENPVSKDYDAKRWDQTMSVPILEVEHSTYNAAIRDKELAHLLSMQLENVGFVRTEDGTIVYKCRGRRCSGDPNTGTGNVTIMCLSMHAFIRALPCKVALLNDGDDCVLICEEKDQHWLDGIPDFFQQMGITMKSGKVSGLFEEVDFCQSRPVQVYPGKWRMVRDPRASLSKDSYSVEPIQYPQDWNYQRAAVADCGLSLAGDLPVLGHYYSMLRRGAEDTWRSKWGLSLQTRLDKRITQTGFDFLARGMSCKFQEPTETARESFALAFGIWPDLQRAMEAEYAAYTPEWGPNPVVENVVDMFDLSHLGK